jgi:UMF1 family MFS transporter
MSSKKERISWYLYDWANSAYSVIVLTVFFGPFLTLITKSQADASGNIQFLGFKFYYASLFAYITSLAVILQVFILPFIGSLADYSKSKKLLFNLFATFGSISTIMMFYIDNDYYLASFLFIFSNICFSSANVIYNSYLNDIAEEKDRERISSIGWGLGYLGGGLALLFVLIFFKNYESFGINADLAIRLSMAFAGIWWAVFSIFPIKNLKGNFREIHSSQSESMGILYFSKKIINTFKKLRYLPHTLLFLSAYLLYNDGVQSVISLSGQFGSDELKLSMGTLTQVILIVQIVAFIGSLVFNYLSKIISTKNAIMLSLLIWTLSLIYAYFFVYTEFDFYFLAIAIALVMGGTQSLSRALFSKIIPKGNEAEFFSIYEISEKGTSWIGPLLFGIALDVTHSYRIAIISLIVFFVIGILLLWKFNSEKAISAIKEQALE